MLKNFFLFYGENHSPDYLHKRLQGGEIFPSPAPWKRALQNGRVSIPRCLFLAYSIGNIRKDHYVPLLSGAIVMIIFLLALIGAVAVMIVLVIGRLAFGRHEQFDRRTFFSWLL